MFSQVATGAASGAAAGSVIGPWGTAIGAGVGALGGLMSGIAEDDALEKQAKLQEQNARMAILKAKSDAVRQSVISSKAIGGETAAYGASGLEQSGSVTAVLTASATNAELDRQNVLHGGVIRSMNFLNQAENDKFGGQQALQGGYMSALASVFQGGARLYAGRVHSDGVDNPTITDASDAETEAAE